jgi:uncharacterized alpha-E superfamily protein
MVFLEKNLPYTLSFLLDTLVDYLSKLPKTNEPNRLSIAEKSALEACTIIKLIDAESLIQIDPITHFRPELDNTLAQVFELICNVSNNLSSLYFNHSVMQHSVLDTLENRDTDEI